MAPGDDVIEPATLVPRQADAPLIVGVECEQLAVAVEVEVVRVAETVGDDFGIGEVGRETEDAAGNRLLNRRRVTLSVLGAEPRVIPAEQVQPTVRSAAECVRVVLTAGLERPNQFRRADHLVIWADLEPPKPAVADGVERIALPEQAHRAVFG